MSAQHTPGPWCINPRFNTMISTVDGDADIAEVDGWPIEFKAEEGANKRVIAAAPDLLEALEKLASVYDAIGNPRGPARIVADAAIAKARGTS